MKKILLLSYLFLSIQIARSQSISIVNENSAVTQDFNTLVNTGTSSTLPNGWYINESGTNANLIYSSGTGSATTGDTYSFGAAATVDRTLGGLQSGSLIPSWGASFTNNTGQTITSLLINYTGKTWRVGVANRADRIDFKYSLNATSLTTGTFSDVDELDYSNSGQATGSGSLQHSANISYKIINLSIAVGGTFWIKFDDYNASGADDGMGIDNFSLTANPPITQPTVNFNPASLVFGNQNINTIANPKLYTINYSLLNGTPLTLTSVAPYKISESLSGTYTNNLALNGLSGTGSKDVYVNFSPTSTGVINSNISHDGGGLALSAVLPISGSGVDPNATAFNFESCSVSGSSSLSDGFYQYSVSGAQTWACTSFGHDNSDPTASLGNAVQMNGYSSGNIVNEDWLISPVFNLSAYNFPILSYWTRSAFAGDKLQLKVSTNYSGIGDPNLATWTNLDGKFPSVASDIWTKSDNISLSAFKNSGVYIALVYNSTNSSASRWTVDDFAITNASTAPNPETSTSSTNINFGYIASGSNNEKSFTFSASNLTGDVTISSTGDFEISKTSGSGFTNSLNFTNATVNNTSPAVYVKFNSNQNNKSFIGNVVISTAGTTNKIVNLYGNSFTTAYSLDVCNWNIEWFGSTVSNQGPTNVTQQAANVRTMVNNINADIYGFAEVVDTTLFRSQVLPAGYNVIFSDFGSYGDDKNDLDYNGDQKLAFMYKTDIIKPITTYGVLRDTYYPSNLSNNAAGSPYKNWSSGRFPFLMEADVIMNGVTERVYFIEIHAKANTGMVPDQIDAYNRRKGGSDQLKAWLDTNLPGKQTILIGDYNDVLNPDKTIAPSGAGPGTSYSAFTNSSSYNPISLSLSLAGERSTAGFPTVIDNAIISTTLNDNYISGSVDVLDELAATITSYTSTTTDHYPILSRYYFDTTTLPIELSSFTAIADGNKVNLKWTTLSEINNNYFIVEHSFDGKTFTEIGNMKGAGSSNIEINYSYTDLNPVKGINYYRLKQVDFNGDYSFSKIEAVKIITGAAKEFNIYPNPAQREVRFALNSTASDLQLKVLSNEGKLIFQAKGNINQLNSQINQVMGNWKTGVYIFNLHNQTEYYQAKLLKQ